MLASIAKPIHRSALRLALGKAWYINKRRLGWYLSAARYARARDPQSLPHVHADHKTLMLREFAGVDLQLQRNKMASLKIACACIDGLIIKPGETFSFWRLVGKPTAKRGFKMGFVLRNGAIAQDIGGGLCQMTNMLYWLALHTELTITERWRHGFDVFPDAGRTQPFASGATCAYNYIDLQFHNPTTDTYQIRLWQKNDWLHGAIHYCAKPQWRFEVFEKDHQIRHEWWGGYSRHNALYRRRFAVRTGMQLDEEFITENHAIMMYEPLLAAPGGIA